MRKFITIILAAILFAGCSSNATAENNDSNMQSSKVTTTSTVASNATTTAITTPSTVTTAPVTTSEPSKLTGTKNKYGDYVTYKNTYRFVYEYNEKDDVQDVLDGIYEYIRNTYFKTKDSRTYGLAHPFLDEIVLEEGATINIETYVRVDGEFVLDEEGKPILSDEYLFIATLKKKVAQQTTVTTRGPVNSSSFKPKDNNVKFELDNTLTKEENERNLFTYLSKNDYISVHQIGQFMDLDSAIKYGATSISIGKLVNGSYKEDYVLNIYTTGTYKGYNGIVYNGDNPEVREPDDACTLIDENTLSCPDGEWNLRNIDGKIVIYVDTKNDMDRYDNRVFHNGYDLYPVITSVHRTEILGDNGYVYFYTYYEPEYGLYNKLYHNMYLDNENDEEFAKTLEKNGIIIFYDPDGRGIMYKDEIKEMDYDIVSCIYYSSSHYRKNSELTKCRSEIYEIVKVKH